MPQTVVQKLSDMAAKVSLGDIPMLPEAEVEEDMSVVGELPDDLKRLYAVRAMTYIAHSKFDEDIRKRAKDLNRRLKQRDPAALEEVKRIHVEHERLMIEEKLADRIFWDSVRIEFIGQGIGKVLSICKGWKVAVSEDDSSDPLGLGVTVVPIAVGRGGSALHALASLFGGHVPRPGSGFGASSGDPEGPPN